MPEQKLEELIREAAARRKQAEREEERDRNARAVRFCGILCGSVALYVILITILRDNLGAFWGGLAWFAIGFILIGGEAVLDKFYGWGPGWDD